MLEDTNFSSLMSRHVIDSNSQKIGRITDAIIDKRSLSVNAFVIKGSGQPMVFLSQIAKLTDKDIVLNKSKSQLKSVQGSDLKQEESLFSEVKKIPIIDKNGETIGIFTDIYFRKGSSPAFQVGGQEFINFLKKKYWTENLTYLLENKDIELTQEGFMLKTNLKELEKEMKTNLTNLVRELLVEANKDGKITADEKNLIDSVSVDLETYQTALMQALEDGIITTQEEEQLEKIKESIVKRAYIIARKDNKISPDEKNLISKIAAYMVERRKEVFWKVFGTSPRPK